MKKLFLQCTGLILLLLCGSSLQAQKIYDCFMFFNELELLEIRLSELYDVVDRFVIVESTETHSGLSKPLYYAENAAHFERFKDKIIHIIVDEHVDFNHPQIDPTWGAGDDHWARENFQRDMIKLGLLDCKDDDIILVSDLDEIPSKAELPQLINTMYQSPSGIACASMRFYGFALNRRHTFCGGWWGGTAITTYEVIRKQGGGGVHWLRNARGTTPKVVCGWHFSFVGGGTRVLEKGRAFAHQDAGNAYLRNGRTITQAAADNISAYMYIEEYPGQIESVEEGFFPQFIKDNISYLRDIHFISPAPR